MSERGVKLANGALVVAYSLGVITALVHSAQQPTVYWSTSNDRCVRVEFADGTAGSCNDLPDTYDTTWVK